MKAPAKTAVSLAAAGLLAACASGANPAADSATPAQIQFDRSGAASSGPVTAPQDTESPVHPGATHVAHSATPAPTRPTRLWQRRYGWVDNSYPLANAATFTLVRGISPRRALRILAPDASTAIVSPVKAQRWADRHPYTSSGPNGQVIEAGRRAGWTMVLEDNGFDSVYSAHELSRAGTAVIIYNSVNADTSFQYAVAGRIVREFDPLLDVTTTGRPLRQERGIGFGNGDYLAQSLLLAERLTGLRILPTDLSDARYHVAVGVLE